MMASDKSSMKAARKAAASYKVLYAATERMAVALAHYDAARDLAETGPAFAGKYGERGQAMLGTLGSALDNLRHHMENRA
jgi:hypothetical protein